MINTQRSSKTTLPNITNLRNRKAEEKKREKKEPTLQERKHLSGKDSTANRRTPKA